MSTVRMGLARTFVLAMTMGAVALVGTACGGAPSSEGESASSENDLLPSGGVACHLIPLRTFLDTSDAFENALANLGCSPGVDYTIDAHSNTWFSVACPDSGDLEKAVAAYATISPYFATTSTSGACGVSVAPGHVMVKFDPNCPACVQLR